MRLVTLTLPSEVFDADLPTVSAGTLGALCALAPDDDATIISFRSFVDTAGHRVEAVAYDATCRLTLPTGRPLVLLYLETDLELSALALWDVAHSLAIHDSFRKVERSGSASVLARRYWTSFLHCSGRVEASSGNVVETYTKLQSAAAEAGGLDAWTFAIPTGGTSSLVLNRCVERILAIAPPQFEIVLCGEPADDFVYRDRVRLLDDHKALGRASIAMKKNALVDAAQHPNLCILHDNLLLPTNFLEGMRRFGADYGICGFQSVFVHDQRGFAIQRYADYACFADERKKRIQGVIPQRNVEARASFVAPIVKLQPELPWVSARYYDHDCYLTGRIYVAKRALWRMCPQNEALSWGGFEDVEHAERALGEFGIPMRINPHCYTQTLVARNALCFPTHYVPGRSQAPKEFVPPLKHLAFGDWRPTLAIGHAEYKRKLLGFVSAHARPEAHETLREKAAHLATDSRSRLELIAEILATCHVPESFERAFEFVSRFFSDVVTEPGMVPFMHRVAAVIASSGKIDIGELLWCWQLMRQSAHATRAPLYTNSLSRLLEPYKLSAVALRLTIQYTNQRYPGYFHHPEGLSGVVDAIQAL